MPGRPGGFTEDAPLRHFTLYFIRAEASVRLSTIDERIQSLGQKFNYMLKLEMVPF